MQFYALDSKGQPVSAQRAQKHCNYACLECGTRLRVRSGAHRQKHFYHLECIRTCSLRKKGMIHLQLQNYLYQLLPTNDCQLEQRFPEINRIADVVWISKKIVFEIQCSPISSLEICQRNLDYQTLGWTVVWILHDKRYNQSVLSPAEIGLQGTPYYFSNMDADGNGRIYDQFEIVDKNKRVGKLSGLKVDLSSPKYFVEPVKEHQLSLCRLRQLKWPFYFEGDLLDLNESDYLQAAVDGQNEFKRTAAKKRFRQWVKKCLHLIILHPYKVLFRYFLEKACR